MEQCRVRAPLSKEMALRIVRKFPGVTLDWLFLGRTEGLSAELARMLSGPSKGNDAGGNSPSSLPPVAVRDRRVGLMDRIVVWAEAKSMVSQIDVVIDDSGASSRTS